MSCKLSDKNVLNLGSPTFTIAMLLKVCLKAGQADVSYMVDQLNKSLMTLYFCKLVEVKSEQNL